jgi:hypothetical protein
VVIVVQAGMTVAVPTKVEAPPTTTTKAVGVVNENRNSEEIQQWSGIIQLLSCNLLPSIML